MSKKKILILGASRYYTRWITAAKELGLHVVVTDRNPQSAGFNLADDYRLVDITDISGTMRIARELAIDGIIAVNDFGVPTAAAVAEQLRLPGISPNIARRATSKALMRKFWEQEGVPSALYRTAQTLVEAQQAVHELDRWPLIIKPADSRGGGSRGVIKVNGENELPEALQFAQRFYDDKTVVIEEFLEGVEHSIETITYNQKTHVLAVSDKVKTPPPYRVDKSVIYPTQLNGALLQALHDAATAAVRALGITFGAAHVELCTTKRGPRLFELGARCGGGGTPDPIVPFVTGIAMTKEIIRMAIGDAPHNLTPLYTRGCVYRFLTPRKGKIQSVQGVDDIKKRENILDCEMLLNPGDTIRDVRTGADRAGFIIAGGANREAAIALADKAEDQIKIEYASP